MNQESTRQAMHAFYMQRAIELARRGWYTTRPNPRVGCVLVKHNSVIGEGWHERAGEAHAERRALADAAELGHDVRGASAYVTLEPCSHTGRTPACTQGLIEAGIACVVVGTRDPNPAVDGQGIQTLQDAGIDVVADVLAERCAALNPGFNHRMARGRPRVRVKLAMSLDACTADANGQSQWITGEAARDDVHRLRAESGAVLIGSGTLAADDPSLTVRLPGDWMQPLRVVLDRELSMRPTAHMLQLEGQTRVFTACADVARQEALQAAGATIETVAVNAAEPPGLDLSAVLERLADAEINDLLVEAGPTLAGTLARAGLVDEYVVYMAPMLIGDAGRGLMSLPGLTHLADAQRLAFSEVQCLGHDLRIVAHPLAHHA